MDQVPVGTGRRSENFHDVVMKLHDVVMKSHDVVMKLHDVVMKSHNVVMKLHDVVMKNHDDVMKSHGDVANEISRRRDDSTSVWPRPIMTFHHFQTIPVTVYQLNSLHSKITLALSLGIQ